MMKLFKRIMVLLVALGWASLVFAGSAEEERKERKKNVIKYSTIAVLATAYAVTRKKNS